MNDPRSNGDTGGMIALVPDAASTRALTVPGGDRPAQLHLTLAFLGGDAASLPQPTVDKLHALASGLAAGPAAPLDGTAFGHAVFNPTGEAAHVHLVGGRLAPIRTVAHTGARAIMGADYPEQHDPWVPHVTAGYNLPAGSLRYTGPVRFDRVRLALGGAVRDYPIEQSSGAVTLSAQTPALAATPHPLGPGPLWKTKGEKLPNYIENVAAGIIKGGVDRSRAIQIAIGRIKDWAAGGGQVTPEVRAASAAALAEWERLKAEHAHTSDAVAVELAWRQPRDMAGRFAAPHTVAVPKITEASRQALVSEQRAAATVSAKPGGATPPVARRFGPVQLGDTHLIVDYRDGAYVSGPDFTARTTAAPSAARFDSLPAAIAQAGAMEAAG